MNISKCPIPFPLTRVLLKRNAQAIIFPDFFHLLHKFSVLCQSIDILPNIFELYSSLIEENYQKNSSDIRIIGYKSG
jgi:hypothetical protein